LAIKIEVITGGWQMTISTLSCSLICKYFSLKYSPVAVGRMNSEKLRIPYRNWKFPMKYRNYKGELE